MPTTTGNQGIPYPLKTDSPGYIAEYVRDAVLALEQRSVMVFSSASQRDQKLVGAYVPTAGMICVLLDSLSFYKYTGSNWTSLIPDITVSTATPTGGVDGDLWLRV